MKRFNIAGKCIPDRHYMVDISDRIERIRAMVEEGDYFCINRGRQYGKTTTLSLLKKRLENEYSVFSISFEGLGDAPFESEGKLAAAFMQLLCFRTKMNLVKGLSEKAMELLSEKEPKTSDSLPLADLQILISKLCTLNDKGIVILIDEVDQASNYESFIKFLGMLRDLFLNRDDVPTFQSVILSGVYNIKNLKLKMRPESQHQYNSPWNIAVPFNEDMSLSADGIAGMLDDYESDHHTGMDTKAVAQSIRDYTAGYPFLVERLCMLMHESKDWTKEGLLDATKVVLTEKSTLFDDMVKKLEQFPELKKLMYQSIFEGKDIPFNPDNKAIDIAQMFDFVYNDNGKMKISNRLFETRLYNLFISEQKDDDDIYNSGLSDKPEFIRNGQLNMPLILERFSHTYTELYKDRNEKFDENEGRKKFIFFMKPIINGVGNYYVEARTRGLRRSDLVIDYLGRQYIIEMKIWHGKAYNEEGELQLADYLKANDKAEGYMLTFNFNKTHEPSSTPQLVDGRKITEFIV